MVFSSGANRGKDSEAVSTRASTDPVERQILAAGNLTEAQINAIRRFQHRKRLTFGEAASTLGLVRRDCLILALSKHYNYPVLNRDADGSRFSRELVAGYQPFSTEAEAYRSVRSALVTGALSRGRNAFAVIGAHSRTGVTNFAANLALSFAQMAVPTLLVDANLRRPTLGRLFGVDPKTEGLVEALTLGAADYPPILFDVVPGLSLLVAGATAPNPQELLISRGFLTFTQDAQRKYGVVIYDTPSPSQSADAYVVASRAGAAILVARQHRTRIDDIAKISRELKGLQCELAGTVLGRF
jgi:chain length determinant protein tyrosine kinase EpsG